MMPEDDEEVREATHAAQASMMLAIAATVVLVVLLAMFAPSLKCRPDTPSVMLGNSVLLVGCPPANRR